MGQLFLITKTYTFFAHDCPNINIIRALDRFKSAVTAYPGAIFLEAKWFESKDGDITCKIQVKYKTAGPVADGLYNAGDILTEELKLAGDYVNHHFAIDESPHRSSS